MRLASFKLRFADDHVRIVPAEGLDGRPFHGPGVDLRGEDARTCFDLARPMVDWLLARQAGVVLRALSVDLRSRRVLVSFDDAHAPAGTPPMALRIEAAESGELLDMAAALLLRLGRVAAGALRRRAGVD
ncbi:MAG TPA: hypothetical protein VLM85_14885 [Polyangiaceae bacterium]|nr:hypothetical protein [Polyangiaceae bacterium]